MKFQSTKLFDGYSACFRQWKADGTHCRFLHGYAVSFRVWFEGDLDHRNWVWDFGGMKRSKTQIAGMSPKDYFTPTFFIVIAVNDCHLGLILVSHKTKINRGDTMISPTHDNNINNYYSKSRSVPASLPENEPTDSAGFFFLMC